MYRVKQVGIGEQARELISHVLEGANHPVVKQQMINGHFLRLLAVEILKRVLLIEWFLLLLLIAPLYR